jgi:hypothetical protein
VTVSEFTFLALGLGLGVASGVALIEIIRARPPARGEVRLTVAQDAVPRRRPATLADDAFVAVGLSVSPWNIEACADCGSNTAPSRASRSIAPLRFRGRSVRMGGGAAFMV